MRLRIRHRYALAIPFALLAFVGLVGGLLNGVDAQGRLIDDYTGDGVADGAVKLGSRATWSDVTGSYRLKDVPRTSRLRVEVPGYLITGAPPEGGVVRLTPLAVTIQVNEVGSNGLIPVQIAQIRVGDNSRTLALGTTNTSGNTVISPHPGRDASVLVCALNYVSKVVEVEGVAQVIELVKSEGSDCPPLPTPPPTPVPSVTPTPAATPTAAPSPSPSPSATTAP